MSSMERSKRPFSLSPLSLGYLTPFFRAGMALITVSERPQETVIKGETDRLWSFLCL